MNGHVSATKRSDLASCYRALRISTLSTPLQQSPQIPILYLGILSKLKKTLHARVYYVY